METNAACFFGLRHLICGAFHNTNSQLIEAGNGERDLAFATAGEVFPKGLSLGEEEVKLRCMPAQFCAVL